MQLKKLEAYGFKSFADKIDVEFDKGITAIVGPNGSGKSNISDAIKWVLGEQNVRNLRGVKAEDIIFTGSESRRAMGVAEVSLYFDNDGTLPVDFREVVVTRRLFRSGESEYYINKSRCRLKDITNLFADSGIGHDSMGIISQNKMDEILNAKPEERRLFFEEAAGITKYRNRKKEAMRKLDDTEGNLQRVHDILGEIENQLEPLRISAAKTEKQQALQQELKKLQLGGLYQRYQDLQDKRQKFDQIIQEKKDQEIAANTAVQLVESRKAQLDQELLELEKQLEELAGKRNEIHAKIEAADSEIRVLEERRRQGKASRDRMKLQLRELAGAAQEAEKDISLLTQSGERAQKQQAEVQAAIEQNRQQAKSLREQLTQLKQQRDTLTSQHQQLVLALTEKHHQQELLQHDIDSDSQRRQDQQQAQSELEAALQVLSQQVQHLAQDLVRVQAKIAEDKATMAQKAAEEKQLQEELGVINKEKQALDQKLQTGMSRLQVMERLQQSYEGFGKAPRAILQSQQPWRRGVCGAVAEILQVPGKYVTAVETALGGALQNIVTEDTDTAKAAIEFLKRDRLGRATFLPLSSIVVRQNQERLPQQAQGVIGWAHEVVETDSRFSKVAEFLLGRTLVVDTLDNALALAKQMNQRLRIVTLEGELLSPGGALAGGSQQHRESSFLNRSEEIRQLKYDLKQWNQAVNQRSDEGRQKQRSISECQRVQQELYSAVHSAQLQQKEWQVSHERLQQDMQVKQQELSALQELNSSAEENFALLQDGLQKLQAEAAALTIEEREQAETLQQLNDSYEDRDFAADELAAETNKLETDKAVLEQQCIRAQEQILLRQRELDRNHAAAEEQNQAIAQLEKELDASIEAIGTLMETSQTQQGRFNTANQEHKAVYDKRMARLVDNQKNEKESKEANQRLRDIQAQLHQVELEASKTNYDMEQVQQEMLSQYGLVPERAAEEIPELEPAELKRQLRGMEREIAALGAVNPNAPQEYQELLQRYDFLSGNAEDLAKAKADLLQLIGEMEATMTKQFKEAFVQINGFFGEIFVQLFGGGQAKIILTDAENVLTAGVNMMVTIPGKKTQNLSVLSGGERALTVVALLFAFLKFRPAPFSVLDEIDAPLDEANIGRFGSFLKEYGVNTQFIIVTHRKGTMEVADTMYGVTIEDAGVSKVLSVKLQDYKEEA